MNTTVGVIFRPDFQPAGLRNVARAAEAAGVDELWLWEDCFQQGGIAQAAVALASTERLVVGVGLIPAPLRNVTTAAMEFATLDAMFPGRTRIAVGHGVQSWMQQAGVAVASPMTLLREYVTALRELLAGHSVSVEGRYVRLTDVALAFPPTIPTPVLIGGTGPKTLRLAGEIADGVVLDAQYSTVTVHDALRHVAAGRAESTAPSSTTTSSTTTSSTTPSSTTPSSTAPSSFSTVLFVACDAAGTSEAVAQELRAYVEAGVDALALQPTGSLESMGEFVALAGDVTGLVHRVPGHVEGMAE